MSEDEPLGVHPGLPDNKTYLTKDEFLDRYKKVIDGNLEYDQKVMYHDTFRHWAKLFGNINEFVTLKKKIPDWKERLTWIYNCLDAEKILPIEEKQKCLN